MPCRLTELWPHRPKCILQPDWVKIKVKLRYPKARWHSWADLRYQYLLGLCVNCRNWIFMTFWVLIFILPEYTSHLGFLCGKDSKKKRTTKYNVVLFLNQAHYHSHFDSYFIFMCYQQMIQMIMYIACYNQWPWWHLANKWWAIIDLISGSCSIRHRGSEHPALLPSSGIHEGAQCAVLHGAVPSSVVARWPAARRDGRAAPAAGAAPRHLDARSGRLVLWRAVARLRGPAGRAGPGEVSPLRGRPAHQEPDRLPGGHVRGAPGGRAAAARSAARRRQWAPPPSRPGPGGAGGGAILTRQSGVPLTECRCGVRSQLTHRTGYALQCGDPRPVCD